MADGREQLNELAVQSSAANAAKSKLETESSILRADLAEAVEAVKGTEERLRSVMMDADRLSEELRQEQQHSQQLEKAKRGLETSVRELQAKLDYAENDFTKAEKKATAMFEQRIKSLAADLENENRKVQEANKYSLKQERKVRELQLKVDEDKKEMDTMRDLVEKLQNKNRILKKQMDEAEQIATTNLQKYRQTQLAVENAEERALAAENSLLKMRNRIRSGIIAKQLSVTRDEPPTEMVS